MFESCNERVQPCLDRLEYVNDEKFFARKFIEETTISIVSE